MAINALETLTKKVTVTKNNVRAGLNGKNGQLVRCHAEKGSSLGNVFAWDVIASVKVVSRIYAWKKRAQRGKNGVNGRHVQQSVISGYQREGVYVMGFSVPESEWK